MTKVVRQAINARPEHVLVRQMRPYEKHFSVCYLTRGSCEAPPRCTAASFASCMSTAKWWRMKEAINFCKAAVSLVSAAVQCGPPSDEGVGPVRDRGMCHLLARESVRTEVCCEASADAEMIEIDLLPFECTRKRAALGNTFFLMQT